MWLRGSHYPLVWCTYSTSTCCAQPGQRTERRPNIITHAATRSAFIMLRGLALFTCCFVCTAIDMRRLPRHDTSNGEMRVPFSTKARRTGVGPAAAAPAQAQAHGAMPGSGVGFSLAMLLVVYFSNNWKVVLTLQRLIMRLLGPCLQSYHARTEAASARVQSAQLNTARKARLERLRANTGGG